MTKKLILDTNCLLAIVPQKSRYRWIYNNIISGKFDLIVSQEILLEYEEQLSQFYSIDYASSIINVFINLPNVIKIQPIYFKWLLISSDPDDDKFVDAYVASDADLIITDDKHFNVLNKIEFPNINICKLKDFNNG